jgi:signal transduction histidine kinase
VLSGVGPGRLADDPVPGWLRARCGPVAVLSIPVRGETLVGRFFALDCGESTADELVLGETLVRKMAVLLDQLTQFERSHDAGLATQRIQLARDLHDGVIQSLAGAALRLESARQLVVEQPHESIRCIEEVQDQLVSEQRELRDIIASLEPEAPHHAGRLPVFSERLERLVARIARHWDLEVALDNQLVDPHLGDDLAHQVHCIIQEALVNAARHGRASRVQVELRRREGELLVGIGDDGHGFPFRGRFDHTTLTAAKLGPVSLKRRVEALGGRLEIDSSEGGARLELSLPAPEEA